MLVVNEKETKIGVKGRHIGVNRVHDHGNSGRLESTSSQVRVALTGGRWQGIPKGMGKLNSASFEVTPVVNDARLGQATTGCLYRLQAKYRFAVNLFERGTNLCLQRQEVVAHLGNRGTIRHLNQRIAH